MNTPGCKGTMELIKKLAAAVVAGGTVEQRSFIEETPALKKLGIALGAGNGVWYRRSLGVLARAGGSALVAGVAVSMWVVFWLRSKR